MLDISNIFRDIKHLNLKKYNSPFPTIFISAQNPDDACYLVIHNLIEIIIKQDSSIVMRMVCRKIRRQSKIDKVYVLS